MGFTLFKIHPSRGHVPACRHFFEIHSERIPLGPVRDVGRWGVLSKGDAVGTVQGAKTGTLLPELLWDDLEIRGQETQSLERAGVWSDARQRRRLEEVHGAAESRAVSSSDIFLVIDRQPVQAGARAVTGGVGTRTQICAEGRSRGQPGGEQRSKGKELRTVPKSRRLDSDTKNQEFVGYEQEESKIGLV